MVKPVDSEVRERFLQAWRSSRRQARDFADYLNQVGLLLTPARRRDLLASELRRAALELENAPAMEFIKTFYGSSTMSALDMQRAATDWLRRRADKIEREGE